MDNIPDSILARKLPETDVEAIKQFFDGVTDEEIAALSPGEVMELGTVAFVAITRDFNTRPQRPE